MDIAKLKVSAMRKSTILKHDGSFDMDKARDRKTQRFKSKAPAEAQNQRFSKISSSNFMFGEFMSSFNPHISE